MKFILSYKLFEANISETPYNGDDISKTELQECINHLNKHFSKIFGINHVVSLDTYKDESVTSTDSYAYCSKFTNEIINDFDNIIGMLIKCLVGTNISDSHLRLLCRDDSYDPNGYSLIFSDKKDFKARLSRRSTLVKVPTERNKILISIICYIIAHLEVMGDKVSYLNNDKILRWLSAPVFKDLIINYCEYLLTINRTGGNLFKKEITNDEVNKIVYNTIIHSQERYNILNGMKEQYPEYYNIMTSFGDIDLIDTAGSLGDMGYGD